MSETQIPAAPEMGQKMGMAGGFTLPPVWAPQDRCYLAWPDARAVSAGNDEILEALQSFTIDLVRAIADFQPVTVLCAPEEVTDASLICGGTGVDMLPFAGMEEWFRHGPPVMLRSADGVLGLLSAPKRALLGRSLAEILDLQAVDAADIGDERSIDTDGDGTALTIMPPGAFMGEALERAIQRVTGAKTVFGLTRRARFGAPGTLIVERDEGSDADAVVAAVQAELGNAHAGLAREMEVVVLPPPPTGGQGPALRSFLDFHVCDEAVFVPCYSNAADREVERLLSPVFKHRQIVHVPVSDVEHLEDRDSWLVQTSAAFRRFIMTRPAAELAA